MVVILPETQIFSRSLHFYVLKMNAKLTHFPRLLTHTRLIAYGLCLHALNRRLNPLGCDWERERTNRLSTLQCDVPYDCSKAKGIVWFIFALEIRKENLIYDRKSFGKSSRGIPEDNSIRLNSFQIVFEAHWLKVANDSLWIEFHFQLMALAKQIWRFNGEGRLKKELTDYI